MYVLQWTVYDLSYLRSVVVEGLCGNDVGKEIMIVPVKEMLLGPTMRSLSFMSNVGKLPTENTGPMLG